MDPVTGQKVPMDPASSQLDTGIVYYLKAGKVVGVVLLNSDRLLDQAQTVIQAKMDAPGPVDLAGVISLGPIRELDIVVFPATQ